MASEAWRSQMAKLDTENEPPLSISSSKQCAVLDATVFGGGKVGPSSRDLASLVETCLHVGCPVYLPEVVLYEWARQAGQHLADAEKIVNEKVQLYSRLVGREVKVPEFHAAKDSADLRNLFRYAVESQGVHILGIPAVPHLEIVERDLGRRPPFDSKGKGYRDTLVWASVAELANAGRDVFLVTANSTDFCGTDGKTLNPTLAAEITKGTVAVKRSLEELRGFLADRHFTPVAAWLGKRLAQVAPKRPDANYANRVVVGLGADAYLRKEFAREGLALEAILEVRLEPIEHAVKFEPDTDTTMVTVPFLVTALGNRPAPNLVPFATLPVLVTLVGFAQFLVGGGRAEFLGAGTDRIKTMDTGPAAYAAKEELEAIEADMAADMQEEARREYEAEEAEAEEEERRLQKEESGYEWSQEAWHENRDA